MNKLKKSSVMVILIYIIANIVIIPENAINAAKNAILLCLNTVIPSLFPFFVLSSLLVSLGFATYLTKYVTGFIKPVFNVNGAGALPVILGLISGYPIGASTTVQLYQNGLISKTESERLIAFTNNSGPVFILGALGYAMLHSPTMGLIIYISHILSALLTGIIFRFYKYNSYEKNYLLPHSNSEKFSSNAISSAIGTSMNSAVESILKVCGFVLLFAVVCSCIPQTKYYPYIYSFLEITGGINIISNLNIDESLKLSLISFFLSFSGMSVILQVCSIIIPAGLSIKPYITGKLIQGVLSF